MTESAYDPTTYEPLTFHDAAERFRLGEDSPSDYLERCLATVEKREPAVQAFAHLNPVLARESAAASSQRWATGNPLSPIDGMPIGIKDLLETKDMPTEFGCEAWRGNFPNRDNAAVWALRQAGAVILGKTVTAELGGSHPGPTTNPFDPTRSPGGSSSGSAAAVAARMLPAAIGSQVGGSIIRPAGYCGNVALKPSQGGINRGERQATSMSTHGVHAGCIEDMWQVAIEIVKRAGGDRGWPGIQGPETTPAPHKPARLIVLETEGWANLDESSKQGFAALLDQLRDQGVETLGRRDSRLVESLECAIADAGRVCNSITNWENRWATRNLVDLHPEGVSERARAALAHAESMSVDDYRAALLARDLAQQAHAAVAAAADAIITLSCPGPAHVWLGDQPGEPLAPLPTGSPVFNFPSSMLFAPAVTMPLISVGRMPVGVQVFGQQGQDAAMTSIARWMLESVSPVVIA
ncbi:MAG: amidase [Chloroflexi bacterium]|nr:amidase [Chloroflexota bacterium]MYI05325.1 amidase [Chloroflexota bacterium]